MNRVLFKSQSVHWATPKGVFDALNSEFNFDFDPCPLGESVNDGSSPLFTQWRGRRVFCNPPYNRTMVPFLQRATEADLAVFLIPARTDTKWFHDIVLPNAAEIRFVKGRLKFGDAKHGAPFPSMIVIFRLQKESPMKTSKPQFFKLLRKACRPAEQPKAGKSRPPSGGCSGKKTRQRKPEASGD